MPSSPDTLISTKNSSNLNFKNLKLMVNIQWLKLSDILLWNKVTVMESSLKPEMKSSMKSKKLTPSSIMVPLSLKLQSC